ncbi:hypothetical protein COO09_21275 [Rhizorhabdus dicambivorans]|uniref:Uncharacterized protein n=1 Tax=Rhizorhabdus dicambivorans TaxID=1850238 RepID=A0A2A4FR59_9SPHN|nr:hypothetical protein CMV14_06105 [Rhizorhabdus dicambivorans]PCE40210.1 hypothetical protein COO09_21275 [Rhizorhabdus dicambivorans]
MLGKNLPLNNESKGTDYSEYAVISSLKKKRAVGNLSVKATGGLVFNSDVFGPDDETYYYGELTLGGDPYSLRDLRFDKDDADAVEDQITPTLSVKHSEVYSGFLHSYARRETTLTGGVTFKDVRTIVCPLGKPGRVGDQVCSNDPGFSYKLALQVTKLWSDDPGERRWAPKAKLALAGPVVKDSFLIFGRAEYEYRFYEAGVPGISRSRRDHRVMFAAGLDFAPLFGRYTDLVDTAELGVMYLGRRSTDDTQDFDRAYFSPSLVLIKAF